MNLSEQIKDFKLILVDPNPALCVAWEAKFKDYKKVEVKNDYFENIASFDCMVSAANSFGIMDGGVDLAIARFFGPALPIKVRKKISLEFYGEQPVGTSMIVETGHEKHPFLAHTPTMRVPLKITRTDHVYLAKFAMLRAVANHNKSKGRKIKTVACPGLGTAAGRVPPHEAARQMELAYRNFHHPLKSYSWSQVIHRQREIIYGGDLWSI